MAGPLAPLVGPLVRWFLVGVATSVGWKLGTFAVDKLNETEWKDLKHTWTGRDGAPAKCTEE
jgi:hypothetical protein